MEELVLKDQDQYPTDEVIGSCLGGRKKLWDLFFEAIGQEYPDFSTEWRYYKDGKSWLMKVVRKSKTVFWVSVLKGAFRITFYFTDKVEDAINKSDIPDELKEQFKKGKRYNKIRGLSVVFKIKKDIKYAKALIGIKLMK